MDEKEKKLLEILESPEISAEGKEKGQFDAEKAIETAYPELDDKSKKVMARLLESEMPSPEEIERAERIARHNATVEKKRQERLAKRKMRQIARRCGKKRKTKRR